MNARNNFYVLVIEWPNKRQELLKIGAVERAPEGARVLWDERRDGPLKRQFIEKVGGLVRNDRGLSFDEQLAADHRRKFDQLDAARAALENVDPDSISDPIVAALTRLWQEENLHISRRP